MIKAMIVDDKLASIELLKWLISQHCQEISLVGQACSVEEAIPIIREQEPDIRREHRPERACADDEHPARLERSERALRQPHRLGRHAGGMPTNLGLRARATPCVPGGPQDRVHHRRRGLRRLRQAPDAV